MMTPASSFFFNELALATPQEEPTRIKPTTNFTGSPLLPIRRASNFFWYFLDCVFLEVKQ